MKIFISYADRDLEIASDLASRLQAAGLDVWYAGDHIFPGDNRALKVGKALEVSGAMIVLLSPAWVHSRWGRDEVTFALSQPRFCDRLIPVQIATVEPSSIPWILRELQIVRYGRTSSQRDKAVRKIIERLERAPV